MGFGISRTVSNKLNNSITKIQINEKYGTGFFMKIEINEKTKYYLITLNEIISQEQIKSKISIDLFYGRSVEEEKKTTIKLDKNIRNIETLKDDIILIEIIKNDGISKEQFFSPDLNYKQNYEIYAFAKVYTIGYTDNYKDRQISSEKITLINGPKFSLNVNANPGSPICSYEKQFVIGIYKKAYNGIFIGEVLDYLQKEINRKMNKIKFYSFEENKEKYIFFNNNVLNQCHNQNENNFEKALKDLETYVLDKKDNQLKNVIDILKNFQNIENYDETLKYCLGVQGFLFHINNIIRIDDNELNEKFYYFIGKFLNILENSECQKKCEIDLFRGATMDYDRLLEYKKNINKLIFYKGFCPASRIQAAAAMFGMTIGNTDDYKVIIRINYKYKKEWIPNCYDISKYDTFRETESYLFTLYTCFKIKEVKITENLKTAEILLDSVGIKMDKKLKKITSVNYNENESVLEFF